MPTFTQFIAPRYIIMQNDINIILINSTELPVNVFQMLCVTRQQQNNKTNCKHEILQRDTFTSLLQKSNDEAYVVKLTSMFL